MRWWTNVQQDKGFYSLFMEQRCVITGSVFDRIKHTSTRCVNTLLHWESWKDMLFMAVKRKKRFLYVNSTLRLNCNLNLFSASSFRSWISRGLIFTLWFPEVAARWQEHKSIWEEAARSGVNRKCRPRTPVIINTPPSHDSADTLKPVWSDDPNVMSNK